MDDMQEQHRLLKYYQSRYHSLMLLLKDATKMRKNGKGPQPHRQEEIRRH
jgi:hypothetical protein